MLTIYCIENTKNGKCYVGATIDVQRRWREHKNTLLSGTHKNRYLLRAWKQQSGIGFLFKILEEHVPFGADEENISWLRDREQHWLLHLRAFEKEKGYNLSPTARTTLGLTRVRPEIGRRMSERQRARFAASGGWTVEAKQKAAHTRERNRTECPDCPRRRPISPETRKKMSESQRQRFIRDGKPSSATIIKRLDTQKANLMTGKTVRKRPTEETRRKMSNAQRRRASEGRLWTPEAVEKRKNTLLKNKEKGTPSPLKGRRLSAEHRKNISLGNIGRKHSVETREKISASRRGDKNPQRRRFLAVLKEQGVPEELWPSLHKQGQLQKYLASVHPRQEDSSDLA